MFSKENNYSLGVAAAIVGFLAFSIADMIMKGLLTEERLSVVVFVSCTLVCVMSVFTNLVLGGKWFGSKRATLTSCFRGAMSTGMLGFTLYALETLPPSDVYSVRNLTPIMVALGSWIFLSERPSYVQLLAIILGFTGALLILPPNGKEGFLAYAAAAAAAFCAALSIILVRRHRQESTAFAEVFLSMAVSAALMAPFAFTDSISLKKSLIPYFFASATALTAGRYLLVLSIRSAPSLVAAYAQYTQLAWGLIFGWLFWSILPTPAALIGSFIILASALLIVRRR
ncbi:DMT family transporter [Agrobacterium tumefaciens]|nr:DMT family transporter [Agrobacterium tumefaciens]